MEFKSEAEMKRVALDALSEGFSDGRSYIMDEFSYANGRSDIVLANASDKYLNQRYEVLGISSSISDDSYLQAFLQLQSRSNPISREHYFSIGAIDRPKKQKALDWLIDRGFVVEDEGKIRTAPYLRRHITSSYSIELKLGKWKTALDQAIRGKSFAEYQVVALPSENVLRALEHEEKFHEHEVGLMELQPDGAYYMHIEPSKQNPYSPMNMWRLNEQTISQGSSIPYLAD